MADFCAECSVRIFGEDTKDMSGSVSEEEFNLGLVASALCEDCGPIQVDHDGYCVHENCLNKDDPDHHKRLREYQQNHPAFFDPEGA